MHRSLTALTTLAMLLGLGATRPTAAQDEPQANPAPEATQAPAAAPAEAPQAPQAEPAPAATPAPIAVDELPEEVKQKREAALKAVAELIVAAEKAGLVQTNVNPPPILDVLVLGRSSDKTDLDAAQGKTETQVGLVNPEAFAAYFTGYAEPPEGLTAQANIRIRQPSEGLKDFFDRRAEALRPYLDAARAAAPAAEPAATPAAEPTPAPAEEPAPAEPAPAPADTPAEPAPAEPTPAPAEPTPAEEPAPAPAEEPAPAPAEEPAPADPAPAPAEEPKTEEPAPADEPKAEEPADAPQGGLLR